MNNYYRTDRTISMPNSSGVATFEVRTWTRAISAGAARAQSRQQALSAFSSQTEKTILGCESVIEVPGITKDRPPAILIHGRWLRVVVPQAPSGVACSNWR
jgi:hypothetical protein